jgi:hypothetical protein
MIKVVMIGNFDYYDSKFVDWCSFCASLGTVWIVLLDNSYGAANSLTNRVKLCRSNKHVHDVLAVAGNKYEGLLLKQKPDLVFIEPGFNDGQVIEELCVKNNITVIKSTHHQAKIRTSNLLF